MRYARIAYMPLATFPEVIQEDAIRAAAAFVAPLKCALEVTTFEVDLPQGYSALGNLLLDVPGLINETEKKSKAECHRLQLLIKGLPSEVHVLHCKSQKVSWGNLFNIAATETRRFNIALLPWSRESVTARDIAETVLFGSGRPVILVPPSVRPTPLDNIAVAWDGSRSAARALGDALPLLTEGAKISVLTVSDEKSTLGSQLGKALVSSLADRGFNATHLEPFLSGQPIAEVLQNTALSTGAQLLVMGGFGHSRLRDFVLGGATKGVLSELQLPTLLSH